MPLSFLAANTIIRMTITAPAIISHSFFFLFISLLAIRTKCYFVFPVSFHHEDYIRPIALAIEAAARLSWYKD